MRLRVVLRLLHPVVLTVLALLMLVLLIWFFGPLISVGESRPLDGVFERSAAIAAILLVAAAIFGVRLWLRRRKGKQLVGRPWPPARRPASAKARCWHSASRRRCRCWRTVRARPASTPFCVAASTSTTCRGTCSSARRDPARRRR